MMRFAFTVIALLVVSHAVAGPAAGELLLTPDEVERAKAHGPWPPAAPRGSASSFTRELLPGVIPPS